MERNGELKLWQILRDGELGYFRIRAKSEIEGRIYYTPRDVDFVCDRIIIELYENLWDSKGRLAERTLSEHLDDVVVARRAVIS